MTNLMSDDRFKINVPRFNAIRAVEVEVHQFAHHDAAIGHPEKFVQLARAQAEGLGVRFRDCDISKELCSRW